LQVYTYNDLYSKAIKGKLAAVPRLADRLSEMAVNRVMAIQGYLHSNESSTASIRLDGEKLLVTGNGDGQSATRVKTLVKKLSRNARALGFFPISPLVRIGDPGQGAHVGGTFPMRAQPGPFESDRLGRPYGFSRVHLIDSSVLPSIPATTITLTVMANAYRIGSGLYDN
jgi:choline dehydrogenase-like flavoprotein